MMFVKESERCQVKWFDKDLKGDAHRHSAAYAIASRAGLWLWVWKSFCQCCRRG